MVDLSTHKRSILEISHEERMELVLDLRARRRESIVSTAVKKRTAPKKKAIKKKAAGVVKGLTLEQAQALIIQLQSSGEPQ